MVGLKFWGATQKSQRQSPNARGSGANDRVNDETEESSGKLKEMDPRPAEGHEIQPKINETAEENTPQTKGHQEVASVEPKGSSGGKDALETTTDDKRSGAEGQGKTQLESRDVDTETGMPKTAEHGINKPTDVQETGQVTQSTEESSPSIANEDSTQGATQAKSTDIMEDTEQKVEEDEEALHGQQVEPTVPAEETQSQGPVLSEEDERFLHQITEEVDIPPPLPPRRATIIADDGELTEEEIAQEASKISLPATPKEEKSELSSQGSASKPQTWKDRWSQWAVVPTPTSGVSFATPTLLRGYNYMRKQSPETTDKKAQDNADTKVKDRALAAADLGSAATEVKAESEKPEPTSQQTTDKNTQDVSSILSSLNLSSINNRVVGISADTQKLLESFNTVLKDIINGGPRAYEDLEKLLSEREPQLDKLFGSLPPVLQSLVKSIPIKMYAALAPQLAAAMSFERAGATGVTSSSTVDAAETSDGEDIQSASTKGKPQKKKSKSLIPSLRSLIGEKGAVAAMLKSILSFLEMRFPALAFLTGANVLMSLSVFILLFVFWYCHKRGKETRLKRLAAAATESETSTEKPNTERIAFYPSLADLESGAVFEKEGFQALGKEEEGVKEDAVRVPLPEPVEEEGGVVEGDVGKGEEVEKSGLSREEMRKEEVSESERKVAELIKEATEGV